MRKSAPSSSLALGSALLLWCACGGGQEGNSAAGGPDLRTEIDAPLQDWLDQRQQHAIAGLEQRLEQVRGLLDGLAATISARPGDERPGLQAQLDGYRQRLSTLEARLEELPGLERMQWEKAHDALQGEVRALQNDIAAFENRIR